MGQNPGSEETKALGPNSTPAPLPRIFPFATQFLQMTKAALLHQQPTAPTPRPARPRALQLTAFSSAPFATPVKARQTSGSEVGMGTAPSGAPSSPITSAIPSYLFPACCPVQTWLSWCSAHFRQSPAKVITCEIGQPNSPTHRYPKVSGLGSAFPDAGN